MVRERKELNTEGRVIAAGTDNLDIIVLTRNLAIKFVGLIKGKKIIFYFYSRISLFLPEKIILLTVYSY